VLLFICFFGLVFFYALESVTCSYMCCVKKKMLLDICCNSGSVEITDGSSALQSRGISIELEAGRGSSLSSDEGSSAADLRLAITPSQASSPSPRFDR
jgi:hypothetical protein